MNTKHVFLLSVLYYVVGTSYSSNDVSRIRIYSHSGGYYVIGNMAIVGGLSQVYELCLLDGLYANFDQFNAFIQNHITNFGVSNNEYRFSSIYSTDGGTYNNNIAMEKNVEKWLYDVNCSNDLYFNNNIDVDLTSDIVEEYSVIFHHTHLEHNDIPRELFYEFLIGAV
jgi:hypothetical protein